MENASIIFAGVERSGKYLLASGGRVLVCVGKGRNVKEAAKNAYGIVKTIKFDGMQFRKDIAHQVLEK